MEISQEAQRERMITKYSSDDEFQFWEGYARTGLTSYEERALNQYVNRNSRVLDIGCGCGREAKYLASLGIEFSAIDVVPRMAEYTRKRLESIGYSAHVVCADVCEGVPFEGQFDTVLLLEQVYQQIPRRKDRLRALSNIRDRITEDGTAMLTVFNEGDIKIGNRLAWLWTTNWELARSAVVDGVSLLDLRYLPLTDNTSGGVTVKPTHWQQLLILRWTAAYLIHTARRKFSTKLQRYQAQDKDSARCKQVSRTNPVKKSDGYFLLPVLALHEVIAELESAGFEVCDVHALLEGDVPFSRLAKYGSPLCLIVAKINRPSTLA